MFRRLNSCVIASYLGYSQYEKYFAAHGFGAQAHAISEASRRGDVPAAIKPDSEEMVNTFAIAGTPNEVRERVEQLWQTADSLTLVPPLFSALESSKIAS